MLVLCTLNGAVVSRLYFAGELGLIPAGAEFPAGIQFWVINITGYYFNKVLGFRWLPIENKTPLSLQALNLPGLVGTIGKAFCSRLHLLLRNQKHWGHCEASGGYRLSWLLGKEMGYEIPTSQMQYHADYKEMDQKDQCFLYFRGVKYHFYTVEGNARDNVENIKYMYLGTTMTNDLKWNTYFSNICTKTNRTLSFLRCNLSACPQEFKSRHIKDSGAPSPGSSVWDPPGILLQGQLDL